MAKRKVKIEDEDVTDFTVEDVLSARAEFDHEHTVRSIGPALILILERDGPMRLEAAASTRQEIDALLDEVANNARWEELLDIFDQVADVGPYVEEWAERLKSGKKIISHRVSEVAS
jgi:hypothetical protein